MDKRPVFRKNPFSPADEFVFTGLAVGSCHFDVTACAEAPTAGAQSWINIYDDENTNKSIF